MNLGNAFARRKQLDAEINNWINRLAYANRDSKNYRTEDISKESFVPVLGTMKEYKRTYTIEECKQKVEELIKEDQELALRISLTNQLAKAKLLDLGGKEREMTVPELLVLKNDIVPKIERMLRAIPRRTTGVEIVEEGDNYIKWRSITPNYKREQSMSDKGNVIENQVLDYYFVEEIQDYGYPEREIFDEIDKIQAWMQRLKEAVNKANETELVNL
ncbi:MAG: hypothetical protein ACFFD4_39290 [Candidatus Odinarchaeota archaeon]